MANDVVKELRGAGYLGIFLWAVKTITSVLIRGRLWKKKIYRRRYRYTKEKVKSRKRCNQ